MSSHQMPRVPSVPHIADQDDPLMEFAHDDTADPGDFLGALTDLLLDLALRDRDQRRGSVGVPLVPAEQTPALNPVNEAAKAGPQRKRGAPA